MFISLPGESHGLRSLVGLVHWVARSQTWLQWLSTQHTDMNYFERLCVYFWLCLGLRCCGGFSLDAENGGYSAVAFLGFLLQWLLLLGSVAPRVPGFSSCVSWALEHRLCSRDAQLSGSRTRGIFSYQDQIHVFRTGRWILSHWATWRVPIWVTFHV